MTSNIEELHRAYQNLTGFDSVTLNMARIFMWERWLINGWTSFDLAAVIAFIKRGIQTKARRVEALKFSNLIENTSRFEEDLSCARQERNLTTKRARPVKEGPKRADGRPMPKVNAHTDPTCARKVSELIEAMRNAAR